MTEVELLKVIAQAAKENATSLDLSGKNIKTIPPEIANLTNLTELYLDNNQITEIPDAIANLTKLTWLNLIGNPLQIPVEILNDYFNPAVILDFIREGEQQPLNEAK